MSGQRPIRILGLVHKTADQLTAHPNNPRTHPLRQRAAVKESIDKLGWYAPVIENVTTGYVIDGHERVFQALETGEVIPVIQVEMSEEEEKLALASHDWLSSLAQIDQEAMDDLLEQVTLSGALLDEMISELATVPLLDGGTEQGDKLKKRSNWDVLQRAKSGAFRAFDWGDIYLVMDGDLHDRINAWLDTQVAAGRYESRRDALTAILESGLATLGDH